MDNVKIKFYFSERVVGRNWTEKIVVLHSDSRQRKLHFLGKNLIMSFRLAWFREGQDSPEESILLSGRSPFTHYIAHFDLKQLERLEVSSFIFILAYTEGMVID